MRNIFSFQGFELQSNRRHRSKYFQGCNEDQKNVSIVVVVIP